MVVEFRVDDKKATGSVSQVGKGAAMAIRLVKKSFGSKPTTSVIGWGCFSGRERTAGNVGTRFDLWLRPHNWMPAQAWTAATRRCPGSDDSPAGLHSSLQAPDELNGTE